MLNFKSDGVLNGLTVANLRLPSLAGICFFFSKYFLSQNTILRPL